MHWHVKRILSVALVAAVALSVLAGLVNGQQAAAQSMDGESQAQRVIHVSGDGIVAAVPDVAVMSLGVETMADTAAAALDLNSQQMQALINTLTDGGVAEDDIRTQQIQILPRYEDIRPTPVPEGGSATGPRVIGYTATNIVEVRITDISRVGNLLDLAVAVGGNRIDGIRFEVSDPAAMIDQARELAWADAAHKATRLARLAGATVGNVLSISESSQSPVPVMREAVMASSVPIRPGTQNVQVHLEVTWEISGGLPLPAEVFEPAPAPLEMTPTPTPAVVLTATEPVTGTLPTVTPTTAVTATEAITETGTSTVTLPVLTLNVTPTLTVEPTAVMPPAVELTPTVEATASGTFDSPVSTPSPITATETMTTAIALPALQITPTMGMPGTEVQVALTGFPADALTVVRLGVVNAVPGVRRVAQTDATGRLSTTFTIPRGAQRGERWVVIAFTEDGRAAAISEVFRVR
jgi:uncharacterized protein